MNGQLLVERESERERRNLHYQYIIYRCGQSNDMITTIDRHISLGMSIICFLFLFFMDRMDMNEPSMISYWLSQTNPPKTLSIYTCMC